MKSLSIIYADDGRKLKPIIQWLIKSWACEQVLVSNYVHQYRAGEWKWLTKTQHKLIQIHYESWDKLISILHKLLPERQTQHWITDISFIS